MTGAERIFTWCFRRGTRLRGQLLFLSLLTSSIPVASQTPLSVPHSPGKLLTQYSLDVWSSDQGLPQNSVNAILQTHDGYLWFGTQEGFVKFDGVRFTVNDRHTLPELKSNYIWSLCEDSRHNLWVGTNGGGVTRIGGSDRMTLTTANGLSSDFVQVVYEDSHEVMWFGTTGGLCRFDGTNFASFRRDRDSLRNGVGAILEDHLGRRWAVVGNRLCLFGDSGFVPSRIASTLPDTNVSTVAQDSVGNLWVGCLESGGAWRFRNGTWMHFGTREGFTQSFVLSIFLDNDGCLWFGTAGDGLYKYVGQKFSHLGVREGLSDSFVRSLYEDAEGSLWIGTYKGGVNRLKDRAFTPYTHTEGLSNDFVLSVWGDKKNHMWIGTYGGGLNEICSNTITSFSAKEGLPSDIVTSLCGDDESSIWIGTFGKGVIVFKNGRFTTLRRSASRRSAFVISLYYDSHNRMWVGTDGAGVERYEKKAAASFTMRDGLSHDVITSICEDRSGGIWLGTPYGLNRIFNGKVTSYHVKDGLSSEFVLSLYSDSDDVLWIGTDGGGLNRFKEGRFTSYATAQGMFDDVAFTILEDDAGYLWMSSNKGIYRVRKDRLNHFSEGDAVVLSCDVYGKSDGMRTSECNGRRQPSGWKGADGSLWFATIAGVVAVDPHNLKINSVVPPIVIERVSADDRQIPPQVLKEIGPGVDRLEIRYTGLSFVTPGRMNFRYKLEGYDNDWVNARSRRTAYYTHLSPGDYRFSVVGGNIDGVWNTKGASIEFAVKPFFYQTYLFYFFCLIVVGTAVAGGFIHRVAHIRRNAAALSHLVDERTRNLREEQKRAEQALADLATSEERYKLLVENANDLIYRTDETGRFTFFNQRAIQYSGYSAKELMGKSFNDFVDPVHKKRVQFFYARQIVQKIPSTYLEFPAIDRAGKKYWMGQHVQLVFKGQNIIGAQAVARDISKRKSAEDALEESRRFIQRVADATPTILYILDLVGYNVIYVNDALTTILGYTHEQIQRFGPRLVETILHPDDLANFPSILSAIEHARDSDIVELEIRLRRADGEFCWVYCRTTVFTRSPDGKPRQILGSALDITLRKEQEEALRQSEDRYRRIFEESNDVVFISTIDGRFLNINPAGLELFGYAPKEAMLSLDIAKDFYVRPEDWEHYKKEITRHGFVKEFESRVKRSDKNILTVIETSNVVRDENGRILLIRGIMRDVTERRRLEEQLIQAQKMESVGTLAGGVAHDFNNILALILTSAELLKAQVKDNSALLRVADVISSSAHRGANIARQLLLFARSEKGEQKAVSLSEVVMELRQLLEHSIPDTIFLRTETLERGDVILGNSGHLHQVVMNLALNARDAMPDGGTLTISVATTSYETVRSYFGGFVPPISYVVLLVSDTGHGMDEVTKQRLFDPFFTTKERGKGTGLGMAIVHGIVKSYHGYIRVESAPGKGATFVLYFPAITHRDRLEEASA